MGTPVGLGSACRGAELCNRGVSDGWHGEERLLAGLKLCEGEEGRKGGEVKKKQKGAMQEFFSIWLFSKPSISFLPSVPVSWKIGSNYAKEDKRARMEEVLQHWNPTNLSGQLLLLIMYAVLMHATFPMLDPWFAACLCRQRLWAVFFQLTGLCISLQEQLQIPRHMINGD